MSGDTERSSPYSFAKEPYDRQTVAAIPVHIRHAAAMLNLGLAPLRGRTSGLWTSINRLGIGQVHTVKSLHVARTHNKWKSPSAAFRIW